MKIRAITLFSQPDLPVEATAIAGGNRFLQSARQLFAEAGYEVQTLRLSTPPFTEWPGHLTPDMIQDYAVELETVGRQHGLEFISIGPVLAHQPYHPLEPFEFIPALIAKTQNTFTGALVASAQTGINLAAIQATAQAICQIGQSTPNGFGNLRFAMLANVAPDGPFFPGSYHSGGVPAFGLATEAADLAVQILREAATLEQAQQKLIEAIHHHSRRISRIAQQLVDEHGLRFTGIDFSLAPYPDDHISIAAAIEHLGVEAFGGHGTLFATAFLTNCIKQANSPATGYCGVMLPVLEDTRLAQRTMENTYTVNDLLLYSAVCGTGLDTVPIPGNSTPAQIAGLLLDVATLSVRLNKPLTARLLPVPGLKAGDITPFDFEYFANSAILPLKPWAGPALFEQNGFFKFTNR